MTVSFSEINTLVNQLECGGGTEVYAKLCRALASINNVKTLSLLPKPVLKKLVSDLFLYQEYGRWEELSLENASELASTVGELDSLVKNWQRNNFMNIRLEEKRWTKEVYVFLDQVVTSLSDLSFDDLKLLKFRIFVDKNSNVQFTASIIRHESFQKFFDACKEELEVLVDKAEKFSGNRQSSRYSRLLDRIRFKKKELDYDGLLLGELSEGSMVASKTVLEEDEICLLVPYVKLVLVLWPVYEAAIREYTSVGKWPVDLFEMDADIAIERPSEQKYETGELSKSFIHISRI